MRNSRCAIRGDDIRDTNTGKRGELRRYKNRCLFGVRNRRGHERFIRTDIIRLCIIPIRVRVYYYNSDDSR